MNQRQVVIAAVCLILVLLGALLIRAVVREPAGAKLMTLQTAPVGIMGTECVLTAVAEDRHLRPALRAAQDELSAVESRMSVYLELSELSRLNAAPAGEAVQLSPATMEVLRLARRLAGQTDGAFDVTCLPAFKLWAQAGRQKRLPTEEQLAAAKAASGWDKIELLEGAARKKADGAGVGLGGIAKGYAVDRATAAMRRAGCAGGLINAGGDIRCFGPSPRGSPWHVAVQNPFDPGGGDYFGTLSLAEGAVCTSGNYERFVMIDGKRYSHIIDPRTARPVDFAPSVTVVAPTGAVADAWATALSVLGRRGLGLIPKGSGIEAMIVVGSPQGYQVHQTAGFGKLLIGPIPPPPRPPTRPAETARPAK